MDDFVTEIYELLAVSPQYANEKALELLKLAKFQEEQDSINWARGYALVELKKFNDALAIWGEIFERTKDHKALHQMGFVHRSAGDLLNAIDVFLQEKNLISNNDIQAMAINFYELSHCHLLLDDNKKAQEYFCAYKSLPLDETDLVERGCFFRLQGDVYKVSDKSFARKSYEQSLKFFIEAEDDISIEEIKNRISAL